MSERAGSRASGVWGKTGIALALVAMAGWPSGCHRRRFPARGDAAAVVVVAPHQDAASAPALAEHEPNDKPEEAQLLAIHQGSPPVKVDGDLAAAGQGAGKDVDVFKLVVPGERDVPVGSVDGAALDPRAGARRLSVDLVAGPGGPLVLQLLDENAKVIQGIAVEPRDNAGMPNLAALPGHTYYLRIKTGPKAARNGAEAPGNSYGLSLQLADFEVAEEREPNDTMATAQPLAMNGAGDFSGFIGWAHDQDFYRIPSPEVLSALDAEIDGVEGVALGVQVLDEAGNRIAAGRGRKSERLALRNVIAQPAGATSPAGKSFYVVVRGEAGQNRTQRYVLHLSLGSLRQDSEIEPNDNAASATPIRDGTFTGFLPIGDVDLFRYAEAGARELSVEARCPARIRCTLEVVRARDGQVLGTAAAKKPKQIVAVAKVPTEGEAILIRLSQNKGDGNANEPYLLNVTSESVTIPKTGTQNSPSP